MARRTVPIARSIAFSDISVEWEYPTISPCTALRPNPWEASKLEVLNLPSSKEITSDLLRSRNNSPSSAPASDCFKILSAELRSIWVSNGEKGVSVMKFLMIFLAKKKFPREF